MTSTSIYTPFTYCLTFLLIGKRYYGVRYAKGCHPDQLWTTYFTSSKTIKALIEEYGEDSFTFEIRKTFKTREEALSWETKFLTKIDAAKHPEWLNDHNGGKNFHSNSESSYKAWETKKRNGTETFTPESIQKRKDTLKKRGRSHPMKNPETVQKCKDTKTRNGTLPAMKNPETIQKAKDTKQERGYINPFSLPEIIQKRKDTLKERGIVNPTTIPFISMIHNKKTYSKNTISRWYPELKIFY